MSQENNLIRIRVGGLVVCQDTLALIYRNANGLDQWTVPGGLVSSDESLDQAIQRELHEELGLENVKPELLFVQDMLVARPGKTDKFRRLHLIFRIIIDEVAKQKLKLVEEDDLKSGEVRWVEKDKISDLHLYPDLTKALAAMQSLDAKVQTRLLPMVTDSEFVWR